MSKSNEKAIVGQELVDFLMEVKINVFVRKFDHWKHPKRARV